MYIKHKIYKTSKTLRFPLHSENFGSWNFFISLIYDKSFIFFFFFSDSTKSTLAPPLSQQSSSGFLLSLENAMKWDFLGSDKRIKKPLNYQKTVNVSLVKVQIYRFIYRYDEMLKSSQLNQFYF